MRTRYLFLLVACIPLLYAVLYWLGSVLITIFRGRKHECPRCGCTRTRVSLVRLYERLFYPAFVLPRRCESCLTRYYSGMSVNYVRRARAAAAAAAAQPAAQPLPGLIMSALNGDLWLTRN